MRILYFGIYSKGIEYPRNRNLISSLRKNDASVKEIHYQLVGSFKERIELLKGDKKAFRFIQGLVASYFDLSRRFLKTQEADAVIVGHPGYFHLHLAWLLTRFSQRKALLIYDAFIPLYEMVVEDRKLIQKNSLLARMIQWLESSSLSLCDLCLVDTHAHGKYLSEKYGETPKKMVRALVGSTIRKKNAGSPSRAATRDLFSVLFVGTYIPLHGIDVIIEAANLLKNDPSIRFTLVGNGQLQASMKGLAEQWCLKNILFYNWIDTEQLYETIRVSDLSLGVFGVSSKTSRVIPSKIYDICEAGVPFITADTPAIREIFHHKENAYLIPPGDPNALSQAIKELQKNHALRAKISQGATRTGETHFSLNSIGRRLVFDIQKKKSKNNF